MGDSFTEAVLPFSSDPELLEEYLTFSGTVRVGKLLEDLDALAGTIAYKCVFVFSPDEWVWCSPFFPCRSIGMM